MSVAAEDDEPKRAIVFVHGFQVLKFSGFSKLPKRGKIEHDGTFGSWPA
jgi:hypothetical protein